MYTEFANYTKKLQDGNALRQNVRNQQLVSNVRNLPTPRLPTQNLEGAVEADRARAAMNQSQALRGALNRGDGSTSSLLRGAQGMVQPGVEQAQDASGQRMKMDLMQYSARAQKAQQAAKTYQQLWTQATDARDKARYFRMAQDAQEEAQRYAMLTQEKVAEARSKFSIGDIASTIGGGILTVGGAIAAPFTVGASLGATGAGVGMMGNK